MSNICIIINELSKLLINMNRFEPKFHIRGHSIQPLNLPKNNFNYYQNNTQLHYGMSYNTAMSNHNLATQQPLHGNITVTCPFGTGYIGAFKQPSNHN